MLIKRKIIEIDEERCNGCGLCVLDCAENAIAIVDGKARVVADHFCDGLGACLAACPQDALRIIEREAAPFDESAVAARLQEGFEPPTPLAPRPLACVGTSPRPSAKVSLGTVPRRWPLKLRLLQPSAPFLSGASLLLAADCAPAASPAFHDLLKGRVLCTACPKFEDKEALTARLGEILAANGIRDIAALRMEVPCCQGLTAILTEALRRAGLPPVFEESIMGCDGAPHKNAPHKNTPEKSTV